MLDSWQLSGQLAMVLLWRGMAPVTHWRAVVVRAGVGTAGKGHCCDRAGGGDDEDPAARPAAAGGCGGALAGSIRSVAGWAGAGCACCASVRAAGWLCDGCPDLGCGFPGWLQDQQSRDRVPVIRSRVMDEIESWGELVGGVQQA